MMLSGKKDNPFDLQLVMKKLSLMLKYQKVYIKMLLTIFFNCQLWDDGRGCGAGGASMKV